MLENKTPVVRHLSKWFFVGGSLTAIGITMNLVAEVLPIQYCFGQCAPSGMELILMQKFLCVFSSTSIYIGMVTAIISSIG
jgi:hypothetical protein